MGFVASPLGDSNRRPLHDLLSDVATSAGRRARPFEEQLLGISRRDDRIYGETQDPTRVVGDQPASTSGTSSTKIARSCVRAKKRS